MNRAPKDPAYELAKELFPKEGYIRRYGYAQFVAGGVAAKRGED